MSYARLCAAALAVGAVVLFPAIGFATTILIGASQDATIFANSSGVDTGNASGKGPGLFVGADSSSGRKRALIEFDVADAGIPADATITNVTMTLTLAQIAGMGNGSNIPSRNFQLFDVLQPWTEGNSESPTSTSLSGQGQGTTAISGDTTWTYASYNSASLSSGKWQNGSGTLEPGGYVASAESADTTITNFTVGSTDSWSSAGMLSDVDNWLATPSSNDGWLIYTPLETTVQSYVAFWSKDGAAANMNSSIAPALVITYTTPEPAAMALAAMGAGLLLRRRR